MNGLCNLAKSAKSISPEDAIEFNELLDGVFDQEELSTMLAVVLNYVSLGAPSNEEKSKGGIISTIIKHRTFGNSSFPPLKESATSLSVWQN